MPRLSPEQLDYIRRFKADNYSDYLEIWRAPAMTGRTRGDVQLVSVAQCRRWPASRSPQIVAKIPDLGGARVDELVFMTDSIDIRRGDELRSVEGERLKVEGVGYWQTTRAIAASRVEDGKS